MAGHTKYKSVSLLGMCLYDWVIKTAREHSGNDCLVWTHGVNEHGYGVVRHPTTKKLVKVHRLAYWAVYGTWPEPFGLHTCDNPPCFNPRHITAGDQRINMRDCVNKGRLRPGISVGEAAGVTHLTNPDVIAIRNLHAQGIGPKVLAARFRLCTTTIWQIVTRQTWKHI